MKQIVQIGFLTAPELIQRLEKERIIEIVHSSENGESFVIRFSKEV